MLPCLVVLYSFAAEPVVPAPPDDPAPEVAAVPEPPTSPAEEADTPQDAPSGEPPAEETHAPQNAPAGDPPATADAPCPCDPIDWRCMQAHATACEWTAPAPAPVEDDELPSRPTTPRTKPPPPKRTFTGPQRTGVVVGLGAGYLGCRTAWCEGYKGTGAVQAELGYRFRFIAPVLVVAGGRGPIDLDIEGVRSRLSFVDLGVGALAFPAPRTVLDPYFGLTLGWSRAEISARDTEGLGVHASERLSRGAARFTFGLNFFVLPRVTLGPRFDIAVPFAGRWCFSSEPELPDPPPCSAVKDLPMTQMIDPADLPRSFAVTLHLRLVLPVK